MIKLIARYYVRKALEYGASPYEVAEQLGLNPKTTLKLHPTQSRLLQALKDGIIAEGDSYYSIARKLGIKNHGTVLYHMNRLKTDGKL